MPIWVKKVILHNIPSGFDVKIHSSKVQLFSDPSFTQEVFSQTLTTDLSDQGTEILLPSIQKVQSMKLEFLDCEGGIYHWDCAAIGDIEVVASHIDPSRFPEIADCKGLAYGPHQLDTCGQCLIPSDPLFNHCESSGLDGIHLFPNLRLFPNPAKNFLNIDLDVAEEIPLDIIVYSLEGRIIYKGKLTQVHTRLDISHWPSGVCLVKMWNTRGQTIQKIVVD